MSLLSLMNTCCRNVFYQHCLQTVHSTNLFILQFINKFINTFIIHITIDPTIWHFNSFIFYWFLWIRNRGVNSRLSHGITCHLFCLNKTSGSLMSFSSRLSHPSSSLQISLFAILVTNTSFTTMSVKSTSWLQPSFGQIQE